MSKFLSLLALLFLAGCSSLSPTSWVPSHRMTIQQGNVVSADAVAKVKPGMTRSQVRFLLGTPLLTDPFHANRWDYVYLKEVQGKAREEHKLSVRFNGDLVTEVTGTPAIPAGPATPDAPATTATPAP